MVGAVGSSASNGYSSPVKTNAGLEAQLERYKGKLSDQETCPSGKTPEGRANIKKLEVTISEIKNSIAAADTQKIEADKPAPRPSEGIGMNLDVYA